MKKLVRRSLGLIATMVAAALPQAVFADIAYDCGIVANGTDNVLKDSKIDVQWPFTKDDINLALTHLAAYCCQQGFLSQDSDACKGSSDSSENPESPYVFDQLVNIGFSKLDNAMPESRDDKAKERADTLSGFEGVGDGSSPVRIRSKFDSARKPLESDQPRLDQDTCAISNYDSLQMAARYQAACAQSECVTSKIVLPTSDFTTHVDPDGCDNLVDQRVATEQHHVQDLMIRKANKLISDLWTTYLEKYFERQRLDQLSEEFWTVNEYLNDVVGKVQEGTRECSSGPPGAGAYQSSADPTGLPGGQAEGGLSSFLDQ